MSEQQWPTDPDFRRFAAKLADAVMREQQAGTALKTWCGASPTLDRSENCPLGCLSGLNYPLPCSLRGQLPTDDAWAFIGGLDNGTVLPSPYNRLGRAYRERFVK